MVSSDIYKTLMNEIQIFCDTYETQTDPRLRTCLFDRNYVKFKRCDNMMIVLYIPTPSVNATVMTNEDRSNIKDKRFAKFRASEAWPICILNTKTKEFITSYWHVNIYFKPILYIVNQWIKPDGYERNKNVICAQGIHFFNHWLAAYCYESWNVDATIIFDESGEIDGIWCRNKRVYETKCVCRNDIVEAFLCHFTLTFFSE